MGNIEAFEKRGKRLIACAIVLGMAVGLSVPSPVAADHVKLPAVPSGIQAPSGAKAFLKAHAVGTQNYICLPSGPGFAWTLFGPQATLFKDNNSQLITHFLSPNPDESGALRATWQHAKDTSRVWAATIAMSSDALFVEPGAIPWLLLRVVGDQPGPTGGDQLLQTTFIQRLNTAGGVAPASGCSQPTHVGARTFVPYAADYVFHTGGVDDDD